MGKLIIPDNLVDVDFTTQPKYVFGDMGIPLANSQMFGDYEEALGLIPEDEWEDRVKQIEDNNAGIEYLIKHCFNQGGEGSCTSNGTAQGMMLVAAEQFGLDQVPILSPMSMYQLVGRSPRSGSMLSDNVEKAQEVGFLPLDNAENRKQFEHVFPATGFYTKRPQGWTSTAMRLRLGEVYICRSVAAVVSAGLRGHPILVGRQGHAIIYLRPTYRRQGNRSELLYPYMNSWGIDWGFAMGNLSGGFGADSTSLIRQASSWAVAFRSVYMEPLTTAA